MENQEHVGHERNAADGRTRSISIGVERREEMDQTAYFDEFPGTVRTVRF